MWVRTSLYFYYIVISGFFLAVNFSERKAWHFTDSGSGKKCSKPQMRRRKTFSSLKPSKKFFTRPRKNTLIIFPQRHSERMDMLPLCLERFCFRVWNKRPCPTPGSVYYWLGQLLLMHRCNRITEKSLSNKVSRKMTKRDAFIGKAVDEQTNYDQWSRHQARTSE